MQLSSPAQSAKRNRLFGLLPAKCLTFSVFKIDPEANAASRVDSDIATINSSIRVFVIKAEENWQIARECAELLRQP